MFFLKCEVNPAFFSPFPLYSLCPLPQLHPFFSLGFSAVFSKFWIKMESGRVERRNGEKCLTTGSWWHRMWECNMQRAVASLLSSNHRRCCEDRPSKVSALTGNILDQNTTLQNKGSISLLPVLCDFSAATRDGCTIQADSGSCLSRAEILQKCCAECLNNRLVTKSILRSAHCDTHYMLLLAGGTVPCNQTPQMGSHNVC